MRSHLILTALTLISIASHAQKTKWSYDPSHAKIGFSIAHFEISETYGKFNSYSGEVVSTDADFNNAEIHLVIDANSIDTENEDRDKHLKSADFFDTEKYPEIKFEGKLVKEKGNNYRMKGKLTMHGVTKDVSLATVYKGTVKDPWGNTKAGFRVTGTINREDWGIGWNGELENGDALIGREVQLEINIELKKENE